MDPKDLATAFVDSAFGQRVKKNPCDSTPHATEHGWIVCDEYIMHASACFIGLLRENEREIYPTTMNNVSFPVSWTSL